MSVRFAREKWPRIIGPPPERNKRSLSRVKPMSYMRLELSIPHEIPESEVEHCTSLDKPRFPNLRFCTPATLSELLFISGWSHHHESRPNPTLNRTKCRLRIALREQGRLFSSTGLIPLQNPEMMHSSPLESDLISTLLVKSLFFTLDRFDLSLFFDRLERAKTAHAVPLQFIVFVMW